MNSHKIFCNTSSKNALWIFAILSMFIGLSSCKTSVKPVISEDGSKSFFGEKIQGEGAISVDDLKMKLEADSEIEATVTGTIETVCLVKGCWMNITSETGESIFVKFKDYGFFMPMDSQNKKVIMKGKGFHELTSVDELRHYAEDEGKSAEEIAAITEPKSELKFIADGVILLEPDTK